MKTYPIYEAKFLGSSDCMCETKVRVSALNKRDAKKRFLAIQNARMNTLGRIGRWDKDYGSSVCDENAITQVVGLRATALGLKEYK